mgnify:FL=1|tara:strand:+ start:220 stop:486 length:267 start_codon:yes stop_codon:yes gene_type:complete
MNDKSVFNDKGLKDKLETLLDDENEIKKWNEGLFIKSLILLPIIIFIIGLFIVNRPENFIDLIFILFYPMALILLGLLILFAMSSKLK